MRILALEPWYGGTHRRFMDGLVRNSTHEIRLLSLEARFLPWRVQGSAVTLADRALQLASQGYRPDLLFASSLVNLPVFLALTRHVWPDVPTVLYFHDNLLVERHSEPDSHDRSFGYIHFASALIADRLVFNSDFHRSDFLGQLPNLLRAYPDHNHLDEVGRIQDRSTTVYPGLNLIDLEPLAAAYPPHPWGPAMPPPIILWNDPWDADHDPAAFFRVMNRLDDIGMPFRLILAGEGFQEQPAEFDRAFQRYASRILHYGYADDFESYARLLHRADLVVSTARHAYFSPRMLEAIHAGCHPLLPDRYCFPEIIPAGLHRPLLHAAALYADEDDLFKQLLAILRSQERPLPPDTLRAMHAHLDWERQVSAFDALFDEVGPTQRRF